MRGVPFWDRVEKTEGCWIWKGGKFNEGYGAFWDGEKKQNHQAHRLAYLELVGEIPEGLHIDHLCRNRACVRPDHMEVVTSRENVLRGIGPSAENARKTHCKHDHEFTPENTYWTRKKGHWNRACRTCHRIRQTAYLRRLNAS